MRTQCEQDALLDSPAVRVLVVDDEPSVRKVLTTLLSQAGVACSAAANAREALTHAREPDQRELANDIHPQDHLREWFDSGASSGTHFPGPALGEDRQLR
jgi:ActR/RegA family two-component response regulator